jgi:hypothetical protein
VGQTLATSGNHVKSHANFEAASTALRRCALPWYLLIPQVRPAHKYPISPWEIIHPLGGDNAVFMEAYTVYTVVCNKSLTATYQCKIQISSNKVLVKNIVNNN